MRLGTKMSLESRKNLSEAHLGMKKPWSSAKQLQTEAVIEKRKSTMISKNLYSVLGKAGSQARWSGHVAKNPRRKYRSSVEVKRVAKTSDQLLERKRFRNQRYKASKRSAVGSHTFDQWSQLKNTYQFMCLSCKRLEPEIKLTEDHVLPLSMGGSDHIENIQPLCMLCNTRKHTREIDYRSLGSLLQILS